jgi:hypothetical protein
MNSLHKHQNPQPHGKVAVGTLDHKDGALAELHSRVKGQVIGPGDAGYDEARTVFIGGIDRRPAVIVRAADAADVAQVVLLARKAELELAIYGGGHSSAGHSVTEGGIMLDLRDMRALHIDAERRTAWAETGLTAGQYTAVAADYGLATGFGDSGSVGIGGLTLGGGVGYLVRKHGLTIDNLLAAEVVTADGQVRRVDAEHHPDLFWAIRGGGGNFGVATRFQFQLHPVDRILGGMLVLPATPEVLAAFIAQAEAAPDELSTIVNIMPAPPMPFLSPEQHGKLIMMAMLVYAGEIEAGERVVAPFRSLATPLADMIRPMRYAEIFQPEEDTHPTAVAHAMFIDKLDGEGAATILKYLQASDASLRATQLRVLGGAMAQVPNEATAFAHRQRRIMVNLVALYKGLEERVVRQAWIAEFAAALDQDNSSAYANFLGDEGPARVRAAYPGATWERLTRIKARYDPTNLFRLNQNIPPVPESVRSDGA